MSNKLATIQRIHSIQPHPNKEVERLEVGKVLAWPVVIKKDDFKDGELVVFITIDSIVPESNPYFEFMRRQKFKVWNARFKGAPSQGLVCPLSILPKLDENEKDTGHAGVQWNEGNDVTDLLGVIKYEKPIDLSLNGDAKGNFPTDLLPITDEDNLLNFPDALKELVGEEVYITVKADGSSGTIIHQNGNIRVCSRRLEQKEGTGFWNIFNSFNLPNKLKYLGLNIAIQCEMVGGKIQGNPLGLGKPSIRVFNIRDLDTGNWYGWDQMSNLCRDLEIPAVQLIEILSWKGDLTIDDLQRMANNVFYTTDKGEVKKGEGIVIRPITPKYSSILGKMWSAKVLNVDY